MGFALTYQTTRQITAAEEAKIRAAADELTDGYTWLSCEPVTFNHKFEEGCLVGFCKPNFLPQADDIESALSEGLPDGTVREMLDVLCELSRRFHVDFELSHDHSDGPAGYIRRGRCDPALRDLVSALGDLAEFSLDHALDHGLDEIEVDFDAEDESDDDDDDRGPSIIKFPGR